MFFKGNMKIYLSQLLHKLLKRIENYTTLINFRIK